MTDNIEKKVIDILSHHVDEAHKPLSLNTPLEDAGLDSLGMVEIIFDLEEAFDIRVPDPEDINEQFKDFSTPNDVIKLVTSLVKEKATV